MNNICRENKVLVSVCTIQAKNSLRRKRQVEAIRMQKEAALANIQQLIRVIQQADTNQMVNTALISSSFTKVKAQALRHVQQPRSYWDQHCHMWDSKHTEMTAYD